MGTKNKDGGIHNLILCLVGTEELDGTKDSEGKKDYILCVDSDYNPK
jgi:hypothetical protein